MADEFISIASSDLDITLQINLAHLEFARKEGCALQVGFASPDSRFKYDGSDLYEALSDAISHNPNFINTGRLIINKKHLLFIEVDRKTDTTTYSMKENGKIY